MYPISAKRLLYHDFHRCQVYIAQKGRSFLLPFFSPKAVPFFSAQAEWGAAQRTRFILSGRLLLHRLTGHANWAGGFALTAETLNRRGIRRHRTAGATASRRTAKEDSLRFSFLFELYLPYSLVWRRLPT
ncbi:MAG: hypothetical protein ACLSDM_07005 [Butyricicoccus sp.]